MTKNLKIILFCLLVSSLAIAQGFIEELDVGNINLNANTISTTNTNGNLILDFNGSGQLELPDLGASTVPYLDSNKRLTSSLVTPTELGYISGVTASLCGISQSCTLTNKSLSGSSNTFTNIPNSATTATSTNTNSAIVARDGSGNFVANIITAALTGNASTATALAANPTDCSSDRYATTIDASGNLTCSTVTNAGLAGSIASSKLVGTDIATVGTITSGTWNGTAVDVAHGGTGNSAFTIFDTFYAAGSTTWGALHANTSTTRKYFGMTGTGSAGQAPTWTQPAFSELSGTASKAQGGTGADNSSVTFPSSGTVVTEAGTEQITNKDIDGGTASNSNRITLPKNTFSNLDGLTDKEGTIAYATDQKKPYFNDGTSWQPVGSGSGGSATNYLLNASFEDTSSALTSWTNLNGTPTTSTTQVIDGKQAVCFALSSTSGEILFQRVTPSGDLTGVNLENSLWIKTNASNLKVASTIGVTVSPGDQQQVVDVPSTDTWTQVVATSVGSSTSAVGLRLYAASSSTGTACVDAAYVGPNRNIGTASPDTDWASFTPTGSWTTNTTYTGFYRRHGDSVDIQYKIALSGAPNAATALTVNLPSGLSIDTNKITSASGTHYFGSTGAAFNPSVVPASIGAVYNNSTSLSVTYLIGNAVAYATQGTVSTTSPVTWANTGVIEVQAFNVPVVGQTTSNVVRASLASANWSGSFGSVSSGCSTTSSSFADTSACVGMALTTLTSNGLTVTQASGSLNGISFTPSRTGRYLVCVSGIYSGSVSGNNYAVRMLDGNSNILGVNNFVSSSNGGSLSYAFCGTTNLTSLSSTTLKLQALAQAGTVSFGPGVSTVTSSWSVTELDAGFPTPLFVGSVTSNSSGLERVERATVGTICSSSPCTITSQSGSWISSVTRTGTGLYSFNIASGIFSAAPTCTCSSLGSTTNTWCEVGAVPTTTLANVQTQSSTAANADTNFSIICMGPR